MSDDGLVEVVIRALPLDVHRRASEHQEELQREFQLVLIGSADRDIDVPKRLFELIEVITGRFDGMSQAQNDEIDGAIAAGASIIPELRYRLPAVVGDVCIALNEMLDECDDYCRRGESLLTLATPLEALAYRRWFLGEFVAQTRGQPPLPWSDTDVDGLLASPTLRGAGSASDQAAPTGGS